MNRTRIFACTALLASLAACQGNAPSSASKTSQTATAADPQPTSALGRMVETEVREAREKLAHENITLGNVHIRSGERGGVSVTSDDENKDNRPKGEITPQGDLLIDGKAVAINADQRAMLLEYRTHVIALAETGMEIGVQGADLAAKAMGEAFKGIFSGKSEKDIEKTVEAEADKIKLSAAKLCQRLPAMMTSQQKLAASLPAFKPYATMTQEDIDNCMKDSEDGTTQAQVQSEIRDEIRSSIRETVRETVRNEAQEAADASADTKATEKR
jgi:ABC-type Fe3+-hydroxamate transport system substrate-binding protein